MADETPDPDTPVEGAGEPEPEAPAAGAAPEPVAEEQVAEQPAVEAGPAGAETPAEEPVATAQEDDEEPAEAPRVKPEIPGADLEVDLVFEGEDRREDEFGAYGEEGEEEPAAAEDDLDAVVVDEPVAATIDLAAGARYRATGKRKTAVARVILKPGSGEYVINGKPLEAFFPRPTLQRQIRQPLEAVGYEERMDVVARMHGGGVSSQAGALRHGISRALLEADPNLRGELKRRGFLTRDSRVKERKKAGLKKARKRPQFSKR
jgi:small subunit ribosomal protein S9